jgi:hypothetical protein
MRISVVGVAVVALIVGTVVALPVRYEGSAQRQGDAGPASNSDPGCPSSRRKNSSLNSLAWHTTRTFRRLRGPNDDLRTK